jgi:hypothetical protein
MTKSDKSKHNICVASIKRSTMKPFDFRWTKFYEFNSDFEDAYPDLQLNFAEDELIICSTVIDHNNFSILTTQKIITKDKGLDTTGSLEGATDKFYGNFKDYKNALFTFGQIQLHNGSELNYFIETGRASMIMIHGVRTLIKIQQMTKAQVDKVTGIWNNQNEE